MALDLTSESRTNPNPELNQTELERAIDVLRAEEQAVSAYVLSPAVTPDAANHLALDSVLGVTIPVKALIKRAYVMFNTTIAVGDATNRYAINLYNGTAVLKATAVSLVAGVASGVNSTITPDQNTSVDAGQVLKLRIDQYDDGGSGPTNISSATVVVVVVYEQRS